jgi:hypothetical protein
VRRRDRDVGHRDPRLLCGQRADLGGELLGHADQVGHHQRHLRGPLLEDERLGLQGILRAGVQALREVAIHPVAPGWRDLYLREADTQRCVLANRAARQHCQPGDDHESRQHVHTVAQEDPADFTGLRSVDPAVVPAL